MMETTATILPAEWTRQSGVQLTWPHAATDWAYMLDEVQTCFLHIAREIAARELLLIVTPEPEEVKRQISDTVNMETYASYNAQPTIRGHATMAPLLCSMLTNLFCSISNSTAGD